MGIGCEIKFVMNGEWNPPCVDPEHPHHFQHHVPQQYPILPLKNLDQDIVVMPPSNLITIGTPAIIVSTYPPVKKNARTKTSVWVLPGPRILSLMVAMAANPTPYHDVLSIIVR